MEKRCPRTVCILRRIDVFDYCGHMREALDIIFPFACLRDRSVLQLQLSKLLGRGSCLSVHSIEGEPNLDISISRVMHDAVM